MALKVSNAPYFFLSISFVSYAYIAPQLELLKLSLAMPTPKSVAEQKSLHHKSSWKHKR
jgi:hypothetical protein